MPFRPGDTGWGERASREQKGKRNFLPRLSLSPPPRCPGGPGARSPVALGFGHPRAPDLVPGALRSFPYGRRPLAEGRREGLRQQATHGGGRGSPAPPRMAGGADRERALCGAALGGRRQDPLPHPLEARSQAGLPGAAGRCALQGKGVGAGVPSLVPGGLCMHAVPAPGAT